MTGRSPLVSIGLPVYNGERFLAETLDSILGQTFEDYEVIISDNASTDRTVEICCEYAARDKRIRYHRNSANLGAARNFNRVFQLSSGQYFKWVAADDLCVPEFLARCVEVLEAEPTVVLAHPKARCIDNNGEVIPRFSGHHDIDWQPEAVSRFRQLLYELHCGESSVSQWTGLYIFGLIRSSALSETHLIRNFIGSDYSLVAELSLIGRFYEVPAYLSFLRGHEGSVSWAYWGSAEKLQEFFDPTVEGRIAVRLSGQRRYLEYFVSIARSSLPVQEKIALLSYTGTLWLRKLPRKLWQGVRGPARTAMGPRRSSQPWHT